MTFHARFAGKCGGCGDQIKPGDPVEYVDDVLVHEGCTPTTPEPPSITRPVCPECFTETAVNGACACI